MILFLAGGYFKADNAGRANETGRYGICPYEWPGGYGGCPYE